MNLQGKNILLAVTGGIAAYKACEVLRILQKKGAQVTVLMTNAAKAFVGELTFEALSQKTVYSDMLEGADKGIAHIDLVKKHDCLLVVPATAESIAKFSWGRADDLLSAVFLAFDKPKFIAPAMNTRMWHNPITQENISHLKQQGVIFIDPQLGELACKDEGLGKLANEETILECVENYIQKQNSLQGKKVVITAGPTREYIDPVRFISSPSTGRMGYSIAKEASLRGAEVILISGPVSIKADFKANMVHVNTAQEMFEACQKYMDYDYFFATAAVSDYVPVHEEKNKIKKNSQDMTLNLKTTQDIALFIGKHKNQKQTLIAFAAETQSTIENALEKMRKKNADVIVANEVYKDEKGFGSGNSSVHFIARNETKAYQTHDNISKSEIAACLWHWLLNES
ncbi:MAG TPA: bifunctional phosphopantothenoylcysteine decarboxylase/phosphopantothenate--cysteine ligase CoaBC [Oligoflexia bacterium]|nr:bifunctional phosphopantothenoylcysteine decarboxylase/phosphopantothenate--cysteine ligase CoaBC [Oligoflexia bacterium]HMR25158.1 bifunctional phosphopantothenoylcysteine decarboxylase/phosphopantothenate--cysteine ligase CoaBC [Oligoflexia bacterium]